MTFLRGLGTAVIVVLLAVAMAAAALAVDIDLPWRTGPPPAAACLDTLPASPSATTGLFVEPDDGYNPVIDEIDRARCEIALSIYLLSDDRVMASLDAARERGVSVRVQLEKDPFGGGWTSAEDTSTWLTDHGIEWRWTPARFQFSHAKYLVIDRQVAVIMNLNLTASAFDGNREFGVVTTDPAIVGDAVRVFDADWADAPLAADPAHLVVSPETSRSALLALIGSARTSIDIYAEVIRDDGFIGALAAASGRGVTVRLIVNESSDPLDQEVYARLSDAGVHIRFSGRLYIHAKMLLVDARRVFIGSQNPTSTSLDRNREVGLVLDDPIVLARCAAAYSRDWLTGIPATP